MMLSLRQGTECWRFVMSPLCYLIIKSIYVYAVSWVWIYSAIMFQISSESASKINALIPTQVNNNIFSYKLYTFTFTVIFHTYGDLTIIGEGLQILTFARHSGSLSSEDSIVCHTYCDTEHLFIKIISEDPWHTFCRAVGSRTVTFCFYDFGLSLLGFEHPHFRLRGEMV